jgi:hypothetical protein
MTALWLCRMLRRLAGLGGGRSDCASLVRSPLAATERARDAGGCAASVTQSIDETGVA